MTAVTIDLLVLTALAVLCVRGWAHGSIREFFSFGGILVGLLVAPWLVGPLSSLIEGIGGVDINLARMIAFVATLGVISIAGAIVGIRTATGIEVSGPRMLDRAGGAMFALMRVLTLVALVLYVAVTVSVDRSSGSLASRVEDSAFGQLLVHPDSPFRIAYDGMVDRSDDLIALTLWVRQRSVFVEEVPNEALEFAATNERLIEVAGAEQRMLRLLNDERSERRLTPLEWCDPCALVARDHSKDMYRHGYFSHVDSRGDDPFDRMQTAGITYEAAGENLAIAPTLVTAHESLMDSPDHRENILRELFDSVGIGCYRGPYGFMCTQVFRTTP